VTIKICGGVLLGALMLFSQDAQAQQEERADKTLSPYFFVENGDPAVDRLPLSKTRVDVVIAGVIASVKVTQTWTNRGTRPINARYIFPASTRAAVHGLTMTIGDKLIRAKIERREKARAKYEAAKREGKSAALLEQQRPNVFSMNLANVMPGDVIDVELEYTELLVPSDGVYEFVYPTVVGPRYSSQPEATAKESDKWVSNPYLHAGRAPTSELYIKTMLSAGMPIQDVSCISHQVSTRFISESLASVELDPSEKQGGNRDFILRYRLSGKRIASGLMLFDGLNEKFFLLMVQPPERVSPRQIPQREYIFIVDVSGSMNGFPLDVTKILMNELIGNLRKTDTFNVVLFAGSSRVMFPESVPATREYIDKAKYFMSSERGGGGTEMLAAIKRAFACPKREDSSRSIVLISDGYVSADQSVFSFIHENLDQANMFSFAIGRSVNRHLMEGVAKAGKGEVFVVTRPEDGPETARRFKEYVESPVLTGIKLSFEDFRAYGIEPESIPDLFASRPLVIFGKYQGEAKGRLKIEGVSGNGSFARIFDVSETKALTTNRALRYLWARTRIANLLDFHSGNEDVEEEISSLGLTYNLLTPYTSFIAVYERIRNQAGDAKDITQPLPLPAGVSELAVGNGSVTSGDEPGLLAICFLMLLIISGAVARQRRRIATGYRS
jgi:Ca-activated chloride channel homolog